MKQWDVKTMAGRIRQLRQIAEELRQEGEGIETVERNVDRILASVRLLEINISDVTAVL